MTSAKPGESAKTIAILGASPLALRFAVNATLRGVQVKLLSDELDSVQQGLQTVASWLEQSVHDETLHSDTRGSVLQNIEIGCGLERLRNAEWTLMTPSFLGDDMQKAEETLSVIEAMAPADTPVLIQITKADSCELLRDIAPNPARLVALYALLGDFLPSGLEVCAVEPESPILNRAVAGLEALGFTTLEFQADEPTPLQRLFSATLEQACGVLKDDPSDIAALDRFFTIAPLSNMGPFQAADLIGFHAVLEGLQTMQPNGQAQRVLEQYIAAGWPGYAGGRGFYDYSETKNG